MQSSVHWLKKIYFSVLVQIFHRAVSNSAIFTSFESMLLSLREIHGPLMCFVDDHSSQLLRKRMGRCYQRLCFFCPPVMPLRWYIPRRADAVVWVDEPQCQKSKVSGPTFGNQFKWLHAVMDCVWKDYKTSLANRYRPELLESRCLIFDAE